MQRFGQAADVVMRFDRMRLARTSHPPIRSRPDRSCPAPATWRAPVELGASASKTSMNSRPMILRFCSGSATPASSRGRHRWHRPCSTLHAQVFCEGRHHLRGLAFSAAARCRRRCRSAASPIARWISAAATDESTPPERPRMTSSSPTCARTSRSPRRSTPASSSRRAAADVAHELLQDRLALPRVRDLGMELHGVEARAIRPHGGDRQLPRCSPSTRIPAAARSPGRHGSSTRRAVHGRRRVVRSGCRRAGDDDRARAPRRSRIRGSARSRPRRPVAAAIACMP